MLNMDIVIKEQPFTKLTFKGVRLIHAEDDKAYFEAYNDSYVKIQPRDSFEPQLKKLRRDYYDEME